MTDIRVMTEADFEFAVGLTEQEGWLHRSVDFRRLTDFEPAGCFIAWEKGEPVGTICSTSQGDYAFLSCLIVKPGCRGRALGELLMRRAMAYQIGRGAKTIELDGVIAAVPLYRRLGFRDKYLSLRFQRPAASISSIPALSRPAPDLDTLCAYDRSRTGVDRSHILSRFASEFAESFFCSLAGARLQGYAFVRPRIRNIVSLGPLIADSPEIAKIILGEIIAVFDQSTIAVGVTESNRDAVALVLANGFVYTQPSLRMFYGTRRRYEDSVFAIISPEKG